MYFCCTPERERKTRMIMGALAQGWPRPRKLIIGAPPHPSAEFTVWGQIWLALHIIPQAYRDRVPFFHIDNGYWKSAKGSSIGYYRLCYRGMTPVLLDSPNYDRAEKMGAPMEPWRRDGDHVLLAIPGRHFGMALGIDVDAWIETAYARIRAHTDRPIKIRPREGYGPLAADLDGCWAMVTHSSNVAVEAVCAGIPVIVEPTSAAAPVGSTSLADLASPPTPDRSKWWASLMCQQFSLDDMRDGTAYRFLSRVRAQTDR